MKVSRRTMFKGLVRSEIKDLGFNIVTKGLKQGMKDDIRSGIEIKWFKFMSKRANSLISKCVIVLLTGLIT
jgi:hypothetical protein